MNSNECQSWLQKKQKQKEVLNIPSLPPSQQFLQPQGKMAAQFVYFVDYENGCHNFIKKDFDKVGNKWAAEQGFQVFIFYRNSHSETVLPPNRPWIRRVPSKTLAKNAADLELLDELEEYMIRYPEHELTLVCGGDRIYEEEIEIRNLHVSLIYVFPPPPTSSIRHLHS